MSILTIERQSRTKICDPKYLNDTTQIDEIPTPEYAASSAWNITDVCLLFTSELWCPSTFLLEQDRTHPPEYYRPDFDIMTDHGTVSDRGESYFQKVLIFVCSAMSPLSTRRAWQLP